MESNEQTETNKQNRDRLIENGLTALGGGVVIGWRDQAQKKRTHGHGQHCGDCGGWMRV